MSNLLGEIRDCRIVDASIRIGEDEIEATVAIDFASSRDADRLGPTIAVTVIAPSTDRSTLRDIQRALLESAIAVLRGAAELSPEALEAAVQAKTERVRRDSKWIPTFE